MRGWVAPAVVAGSVALGATGVAPVAVAGPTPGATRAPLVAVTTTTAVVGAPLGDPRSDVALPVFPAGTAPGVARRWLATAVTARLGKVALLGQTVTASSALSAAQRSTLGALLTATDNALNSAAGQVSGITTLAGANAVANGVVGTRLYSVVAPEVQIVANAAVVQAGAARLQSLEGAFETAISALRRGGDAARVTRTYARFSGEVSRANVLATASANAALAVTPALATGAPSDFAAARQSLQASQTTLQSARTDLRRLVTLLAKPALRRLALPAG